MPGDCISIDHYISAVQSRLEHTFGREWQGYTCGTIFVDHATGKIFNYCQLSNNASDTICSKCKVEQHAKAEGFTIKKYHSDNGVFTSAEFKDDCEKLGQEIDFSGVGTQHQNGVAEWKLASACLTQVIVNSNQLCSVDIQSSPAS